MQSRIIRLCKRLRGVVPATFLDSPETRGAPLDGLIATILSQHTSDVNSRRAFERLRAAYPAWRDVLAAPRAGVEAAITCGGLARVKAVYIHEVLAALAARDPAGEPNLDFLRGMPTDAARNELMSLPGVGRKTADCVLLFTLGRPVCPVDTHVHRVAKRLGLVAAGDTADQTAVVLARNVPPDCALTLHIGLIRVGRTTCRPRTPDCPACTLRDLCPRQRLAR